MSKPTNSENQPHFEQQISALYQQRKQQHKAPAKMKKTALNKKKTGESVDWRKLTGQFQWLAIAASTLLLVSLVALQVNDTRLSEPDINYTSVQIHQLESEPTQTTELNMLYAQSYQEYMQQKSFLLAHHQKSAILSRVNNGWELTTCDEELVKISAELMAAFHTMNIVPNTIKTGEQVSVAFNAAGKIVGIKPRLSYLQC